MSTHPFWLCVAEQAPRPGSRVHTAFALVCARSLLFPRHMTAFRRGRERSTTRRHCKLSLWTMQNETSKPCVAVDVLCTTLPVCLCALLSTSDPSHVQWRSMVRILLRSPAKRGAPSGIYAHPSFGGRTLHMMWYYVLLAHTAACFVKSRQG